MPRIEEAIEIQEARVAKVICELAESIEQLCYLQDAQGISPSTVRELHRAYRVLHGATSFYFGQNSPLAWTAPDYKFRPKEKK